MWWKGHFLFLWMCTHECVCINNPVLVDYVCFKPVNTCSDEWTSHSPIHTLVQMQYQLWVLFTHMHLHDGTALGAVWGSCPGRLPDALNDTLFPLTFCLQHATFDILFFSLNHRGNPNRDLACICLFSVRMCLLLSSCRCGVKF